MRVRVARQLRRQGLGFRYGDRLIEEQHIGSAKRIKQTGELYGQLAHILGRKAITRIDGLVTKQCVAFLWRHARDHSQQLRQLLVGIDLEAMLPAAVILPISYAPPVRDQERASVRHQL